MGYPVAIRAPCIWESHCTRSIGIFEGILRDPSGYVEVESWERSNEGGPRTAELFRNRPNSVNPELTPTRR